MKYDDNNSANRKILESWFECSSIPANPSESITRISISSCSGFSALTVLFQIHNPFVHGFIVGPTLNPFLTFFNKTRLTIKLFPVLYLPTIEITPSFFPLSLCRNSSASGVTENLPLLSTLIN